ncbi:hypothetical protein [Nocardia neocaledoniensis]|uniref:hypothetical protein n=1 Tax=Nocardia neocaledoniensis TaxID=236511 RepID=UPI0024585626|nr:hypothetical protein [Nocardia neocaledoniensis]
MAETVDGVLDDGAARGLGFFTDLTPRYLRAFPTAQTLSLQAIYTTYDAERQLNLQTLSAAAAGLQLALTTANTQKDKQKQISQVLPVAWQGEAATSGIRIVANLATHAETDATAVQKVLDALNAASTAILQTVKDKVQAIDGALVDGKVEVATLTPADIDQVIDAKASGEIDKDVWQKLMPGAIFPKKQPELIKTECERWLKDVFAFRYDKTLTAFTTACSIARTAIEGKYDAIITALDAVDEKSYDGAKDVSGTPGEQKQPQGDPQQQQAQGGDNQSQGDQTGGSTQQSAGNPTTTAGTQTGDTSGTKTVTQNTDDASTDDSTSTDDSDTTEALDTLTSTISELGTTLSSALTGDLGDSITSAIESVGTSVSDGIEQLSEQASSLLSGEHEASFQLGDTKVSITAGENGLSLTTTAADGTTTEYSLTLDENGNPVLTQDSGTADSEGASTDQGDGQSAGEPASGTPQSEPGAEETGQPDPAGQDAADQPDSAVPDAPEPTDDGAGGQPSGPVPGGIPAVPRSTNQESDGEHTPSVENHPVGDSGGSGAVLAEAGPL